jgi:hypothetical protein
MKSENAITSVWTNFNPLSGNWSDALDLCRILTYRDGEEMVEQCFIKKGSKPPVCVVHEVALIRNKVPIDSLAPQLGRVTCLLCPVSGMVLQGLK